MMASASYGETATQIRYLLLSLGSIVESLCDAACTMASLHSSQRKRWLCSQGSSGVPSRMKSTARCMDMCSDWLISLLVHSPLCVFDAFRVRAFQVRTIGNSAVGAHIYRENYG